MVNQLHNNSIYVLVKDKMFTKDLEYELNNVKNATYICFTGIFNDYIEIAVAVIWFGMIFASKMNCTDFLNALIQTHM